MRSWGPTACVAVIVLVIAAASSVRADTLAAGRAAFQRSDYVTAARLLGPVAEHGNSKAQMLIGFMFANGRGLPQSYDAAVYWYRLSAEQGDSTAQHLLGLMYDKGQGVPLDAVLAYKWLNLAAAGAPKSTREYYLRLRDAVASKMTRAQIEAGQSLALHWVPSRF